jgi:hypothetical protein
MDSSDVLASRVIQWEASPAWLAEFGNYLVLEENGQVSPIPGSPLCSRLEKAGISLATGWPMPFMQFVALTRALVAKEVEPQESPLTVDRWAPSPDELPVDRQPPLRERLKALGFADSELSDLPDDVGERSYPTIERRARVRASPRNPALQVGFLAHTFPSVPRIQETEQLDVLVLAGDIACGTAGIRWAKTLPLPVVYVPGNMEHYGFDYYENLSAMRKEASGSNVRFLEKESVVIEGVRFLGANGWSDFGNADPRVFEAAIKEGNDSLQIEAKRWWSKGAKRREQWARFVAACPCSAPGYFNPLLAYAEYAKTGKWLAKALREPFAGNTVVVTHSAPSPKALVAAGTLTIEAHAALWEDDDASAGDYFPLTFVADFRDLMEQHSAGIGLWLHSARSAPVAYEELGIPCAANALSQPGITSRTKFKLGMAFVPR